jgi:hypothetical protein
MVVLDLMLEDLQMLRAVLFVAAISCAAGNTSAQELDGRLKQIYEGGAIKLAYRSDANPFSFVSDGADYKMLPENLSTEPYALALPRGDRRFRAAVNR